MAPAHHRIDPRRTLPVLALLLAFTATNAAGNPDAGTSGDAPPMLIEFTPHQPDPPMPQYRSLWRARVSEEAIRQPPRRSA